MTTLTATEETLRIATECLAQERRRSRRKNMVIVILYILLCATHILYQLRLTASPEQNGGELGQSGSNPRLEDTVSPTA